MGSAKRESDDQILLKTLPDLIWKHIFQNLLFDFKTLDSCSNGSDYLDDLIKRNEHVSIISGDASRSFGCVPRSTGLILFPDAFLPKPQLTAINICVSPTFEPINDYLECLIESQRDSLEILQISCLGLKDKPFGLTLAGMNKLRVLRIERTMIRNRRNVFSPSLTFPERPFLPALESLTLSVLKHENWRDLLLKPVEHLDENYGKSSTFETVTHLCLLPPSPFHSWWTSMPLGSNLFPNLVSLEIPPRFLDYISSIFPAPGNLKRLTLTLPTEELHKHLYDEFITGFSEGACAALLAKPDADPNAKICKEIEEENERHLQDFEEYGERICAAILSHSRAYRQQHLDLHESQKRWWIRADDELRREGIPCPNLTYCTGLEEVTIKSDTGNWGPTVVSYAHLLNTKSLRTLRFLGFYPKYIPDGMMMKLKERFNVIITPKADDAMDSSKLTSLPIKQNLLDVLPEAVWKQVLRHLSSSFQTQKSCSEACDKFEDLMEKAGLLSVNRDKIVPRNFGNRISLHRGISPIPRITTMNICVNSNFQPMAYYFNCLLKSQRDSLEILRISCLEIKSKPFKVDLPEMGKLRDLTLVRTGDSTLRKSLHFRETAFLPALESLTLSAFGVDENWKDFLEKPAGSENPDYPTCEAVKHLRILPARPTQLQTLIWELSEYVFPNLVSLEIPTVLLDKEMHNMFPAPETLKRLTLTLPTEGLHKHVFDVAITGYGEAVCAAIFANPDRDPQEIRAEIEEENELHLDDFDELEQYRITADSEFRLEGRRFPNLTHFHGLEELTLKSDTGDYGTTGVSYPDLLNMKSLRILRFSGHRPKYIPDDMINDLKERFMVFWD